MGHKATPTTRRHYTGRREQISCCVGIPLTPYLPVEVALRLIHRGGAGSFLLG